jgi:hypothetical protein
MKAYIDEGIVSSNDVRYSEARALKIIREILKDDCDMLELFHGLAPSEISDDEILRIGYEYYSIYKD